MSKSQDDKANDQNLKNVQCLKFSQYFIEKKKNLTLLGGPILGLLLALVHEKMPFYSLKRYTVFHIKMFLGAKFQLCVIFEKIRLSLDIYMYDENMFEGC